MDYNVVSKGAADTINAYLRDPKKYEQGLKTFYSEGVKNPSVARILFHNEVIKNAQECVTTQKKLNKEYYEFKPSVPNVKPFDLKPVSITKEMIVESAVDLFNTFSGRIQELNHKNDTLLKMEVNKRRMLDPIRILEDFNPPEHLKQDKEAFDTAFDTMYPKTGEIRKKIIYYNIRKDRVTPHIAKNKQYLVTESKEGWHNQYPKTASTRLDILEGKKPERPNTWTKIKNFFKSAEKLAKENEIKLEEQKRDYEIKKISRAFTP